MIAGNTVISNNTYVISNLTATSFTLADTTFTTGTGGNSGTWTLANGSVANFTSTSLPLGTDSILAIYNNALNYSSSYSATPASFVVNQGPTTTTLVPPAAVINGQPITLTAHVQITNASAPATSGTVVFVAVGTTTTNISSVVSAGTSGLIQINTASTAGLSNGSYVTLSGTGTSSDGTFMISNLTATSFILANSFFTGGSSNSGTWVLDSVLGTSTVTAGSASLTLTTASSAYPSVGSHPVAAAYLGATNLPASGSASATQVVQSDPDLADAVQFTISTPGTATAGTAFTITVIAYDQYGNVATGYTGTVNLTTTDPAGVISPNSGTLSDGIGTFTVTLESGGNWTITATAPVTRVTQTSAAITVAKTSRR